MGIIITSSESCSNEKMPIKCLASSLNQHFVNVSCYDFEFKFLETGLAFMKLQIDPSSAFLHLWPENVWKPQDDCHDSNGTAPCQSPRMRGLAPRGPMGTALAITSNSCYCQHHRANVNLDEKAGSPWVRSYTSQSINKISNAPSSEWWGSKGVDRPGHWVCNPASNCILFVECQIKVKRNHERIEPTFNVQD